AIPALLASCTVKAAIAFAGGPAGQAAISPRAMALTREVLASRLSFTVTLWLTASTLLALGTGYLVYSARHELNTEVSNAQGARVSVGEKPLVPNAKGRDRFGDPLPRNVVARLGTMRLHHGGGPYAATFSSDGKRLASVSSTDNTIRIWDSSE